MVRYMRILVLLVLLVSSIFGLAQPARAQDGFTASVKFTFEGSQPFGAVEAAISDSPVGQIPVSYAVQFKNYYPKYFSQAYHPAINVYSVNTVQSMTWARDNDWSATIDALETLLDQKPDLSVDNKDQIPPFMPPVPASGVIFGQYSYVKTETVIGYRYVAFYTQAAMLPDAKSLRYMFQGLTTDSQYLISASFPIYTAFLPKDADMNVPDEATMNKAVAEIEKQLATAVDAKTFTPSLATIDKVVGSLTVQAGGSMVPTKPCENSPETRLSVGIKGRVTPGDANSLRVSPDGDKLGLIPAGGVFDILDGPQCSVNGITYWKVNYQGKIGWTAEGKDNDYYLEPVK